MCSLINSKLRKQFQLDEVRELHSQGIALDEIAKRVNMPKSFILDVIADDYTTYDIAEVNTDIKIEEKVRFKRVFNNWDPTQNDTVIKEYLEGKSAAELAHKYNFSDTTIRNVLHKYNIPLRPQIQHTKEYLLKEGGIKEGMRAGKTVKEIAAELNLKYATVYRNVKCIDPEYKTSIPLGPRNNEIVNKYVEGNTLEQLAEEFSVKSYTIRKILKDNNTPLRVKAKINPENQVGKRLLKINQINEAWLVGKSFQEIAEEFNLKVPTIQDKISKLKPKVNYKAERDERNSRIVEGYNGGKGLPQLAGEYSVSEQSIRKVLRDNNIILRREERKHQGKGTRQGKRSLKINLIKEAMLAGKTVNEIANSFSFKPDFVYDILFKIHQIWILPNIETLIVEAWLDKQKAAHISKMYNIEIGEVYKFLQERNLDIAKQNVKGDTEIRYLDVKKLHEQGKSYKEIAAIYNMNPKSIWNLLRFRDDNGSRLDANNEKLAHIVEKFNNGTSREELAKEYNKTVIYITNVLRRNGHTFFDPDRVEKIKAYYLSGKTIEETMQEFGVLKPWVQRVLKLAGIPYETKFETNDRIIATLFKQGLSNTEIGIKTGVSPEGIRRNLQRNGIITTKKNH